MQVESSSVKYCLHSVLILLRLHVSLQPMRTRLWLLIALLLLGTAVRLYYLQAQSIWFDEGWSAYAAVQPSLRAAIEADATNPPENLSRDHCIP